MTRNALGGDSDSDHLKPKSSPWVRLSIMRLIGVVPWSGINIACGVCGVSLTDCMLGTFIGCLPWTAVTCQVWRLSADNKYVNLVMTSDWWHPSNCRFQTHADASNYFVSIALSWNHLQTRLSIRPVTCTHSWTQSSTRNNFNVSTYSKSRGTRN